MTSRLEKNQNCLEKRMNKVDLNIKRANENQETLQLDVDAIQHIVDENNDRVNNIDDRLENIEIHSLKCNLRIFGLHEISKEQKENNFKQHVVDNVLKVACTGSTTVIQMCLELERRVSNSQK